MADESLSTAETLGTSLQAVNSTLSIAESATGGSICSKVTTVPGASAYFIGGMVTYAYEAKLQQLGVPREELDEHGAVSEPVARSMARGVRDRFDTTWGLSITGVAGPTGGSTETPIGTMYIGIGHAGEWGTETTWTRVHQRIFDGDRESIIAEASETALSLFLDEIVD